MNFEQHAFISYSHLDNAPSIEGQDGWVTQFHKALEVMLSRRLGEKARIWRDQKLDGNHVFAKEIIDQFAKTALLISILSPGYLRSSWTRLELQAFCDAAALNGGVTIGTRSRVFKIKKLPIEPDADLPELMQEMLGFDFFGIGDDDSKELDPTFGPDARAQFLSRLSDLAFRIAACLQQIAQIRNGKVPDANKAVQKIFLADCGRDLRTIRDQLSTELQMLGHVVLPTGHLPVTEDALIPEIQLQLTQCHLSIHLVGRSIGPIPDGPSGRSLMMLENDLAVAQSRSNSLRRVIWIPEDVAGERPEQQTFIDALQRDAALQYGADLVRGDLKAFKGSVYSVLRSLDNHKATTSARGPAVVHLMMSEADSFASIPLIKLLRTCGVQVTTPVFTGDDAAVRDANIKLVSDCDAVLLFYGTGDDAWRFRHLNELQERANPGASARCPIWICLAPPTTPDKDLLQACSECPLIDARSGLSEIVVQPLLSALSGVGSAS